MTPNQKTFKFENASTMESWAPKHTLYRKAMIALALGLGLPTFASAQQLQVRASVKIVLGPGGAAPAGLGGGENGIRAAFEEANSALTRLGAGWTFTVTEIVQISGAAEWFETECAQKAQMEVAAKGDPARFAWRADAVNFYVLELNQCEGVCSFPHMNEEIILMNGRRADTIRNGIIWLHETGHYFGLTHTFQSLQGNSDPQVCTSVGGVDPQGNVLYCPDNCPHDTNVMSYFSGINGSNARLSDCQMDIMWSHLNSTRRQVVATGPITSDDDEYEPNDSFEQARDITASSYSLNCLNDDWFRFNASGPGTLTISVAGAAGDLDLFVGTDQEWLAESTSATSNEFAEIEVNAGSYILVVTPYNAMFAPYQLIVGFVPSQGNTEDEYEPNDTFDQAISLNAGSYSLQGLNDDWFTFSTTQPGRLTVDVIGETGDLDLFVGTSDVLLGESATEATHETVDIEVPAGTYFMVVTPYDGLTSAYQLVIAFSPEVIVVADDTYEPNDTFEQAREIGIGTYQLQGLDDDIFRFSALQNGKLTVTVNASTGDLDLYVATEQELLGESASESSNEEVQVEVLEGPYFLIVTPYEGMTASYQFTVRFEASVEPMEDDDFEENDDISQARSIPMGTHRLVANDDDWFRIRIEAPGKLSVNIESLDSDVDLAMFDEYGERLIASESTGSYEHVEIEVAPGVVMARIRPISSTGGSYLQTIQFEAEEVDLTPTEPSTSQSMCGAGASSAMLVGFLGFMGLSATRPRRSAM